MTIPDINSVALSLLFSRPVSMGQDVGTTQAHLQKRAKRHTTTAA